MQIGPVREREVWQCCLRTLPGATVFHDWDWLHIMGAALGCHFLRLGFYRGNILVGLAPLLVRQFGPYKTGNWTPFPYLGPLIASNRTREALQALDTYQRRNGISLLQLGFSPHAAMEVAPLKSAGYAVRHDTTMIVELAGRSEDDLLAGMSAKRRSRIRRAQRAGIEVRRASEGEMRNQLYSLLRDIYARQGLPVPYPEATFGRVWERYQEDPHVRMTAAHYEGKPVAVSITIGDGVRAYNWQAAGSRHLRQFNPMTVLYWEDIRWAAACNYREIDLVGNPNPGIAHYKREFGAVERSYPVATRENWRLAAWARSAYGHLRQLRLSDAVRVQGSGDMGES
jgi:hypothetical protein